jgi:hypothetical protein
MSTRSKARIVAIAGTDSIWCYVGAVTVGECCDRFPRAGTAASSPDSPPPQCSWMQAQGHQPDIDVVILELHPV